MAVAADAPVSFRAALELSPPPPRRGRCIVNLKSASGNRRGRVPRCDLQKHFALSSVVVLEFLPAPVYVRLPFAHHVADKVERLAGGRVAACDLCSGFHIFVVEDLAQDIVIG